MLLVYKGEIDFCTLASFPAIILKLLFITLVVVCITSVYVTNLTIQYYNFALNSHIYFKVIKRENNLLHLLIYFLIWYSLFLCEDLNFYEVSFPFNLKNFLYNKLALFLFISKCHYSIHCLHCFS